MSKFLSLEWFKDKVDHSIEKVIEKKLDALINEQNEVSGKPYNNAMLVNDVLTIIMNDGSVITKSGATQDDFDAVNVAKNVAELYSIVSDSNVVSCIMYSLTRFKRLHNRLIFKFQRPRLIIKCNHIFFE